MTDDQTRDIGIVLYGKRKWWFLWLIRYKNLYMITVELEYERVEPSRTVMWNLLDYRVKGMWDEYGECQNNLFVINEKEIREQINHEIF